MPLVVRNDLNAPILPHTHAAVCGPQVDSDARTVDLLLLIRSATAQAEESSLALANATGALAENQRRGEWQRGHRNAPDEETHLTSPACTRGHKHAQHTHREDTAGAGTRGRLRVAFDAAAHQTPLDEVNVATLCTYQFICHVENSRPARA